MVFDDFGVSETDVVFTAIEPHLVVEGTLRTREGRGLAVLGEVNGAIVSDGTVFIGPGATVRGPVTAAKLIVAGELLVAPAPASPDGAEAQAQPCVVATTLLQIKRGGSVIAPRISYGELEAERGSRVRGEMLASDSPTALRRPAPRVVHGAFTGSAAPIPASLLKTDPSRPSAKAAVTAAGTPSAARAASPAAQDLGVLAPMNATASRAAPASTPAAAPIPQAAPLDLGPVPTDLGPVSFSDSLGPIPGADRAAS
jgi:cytoskeletal protein CcmA (bactofilin family)